MKPLSMDELRELRADFAHLALPDDQVDDMIRMIDNIIISIIDQNNGRYSVQLSLSARANYAFYSGEITKASSLENDEKGVDLRLNHARTKKNTKRDVSPG